jgi:F-type H+-transporting ATPase subunit epsilon
MFKLSIVTAEQTVYEGTIVQLVAPAVDGEIAILTNHHPLVTKLGPGALRVQKEDGSEETLYTSGGFLEVNNNQAIILADVVEDIGAIEADEARAARERAHEMMKHTKDDVEREKLEQELRAQMVRERLAQVSKYKKRAGGTESA